MSRRSSISTRSSGSRRKSSKVQETADNDDNESVYSTTA